MAGSVSSGVEIPPSFKFYGPTMPRPGQPGAMQFDGKNITEFLNDWNIECEDFGLTEPQRCARFPNYCTKDIKETIKLLSGYISNDWATLQKEVTKLYWTRETPTNTMAALSKLVNEASTMDLNIYVLKYTSISSALVTAHGLSPLDRVARLIDGLSEDVRRRVIRYCTQKGWKLSTQDAGKLNPDYNDITSFILTEACTNQTMAVFNSERTIRERYTDTVLTPTNSVTTPTVSTSPPVMPIDTETAQPSIAPTSVPSPWALAPLEATMSQLTDQFSRMTLMLQAHLPALQQPGINYVPQPTTPSRNGYGGGRPWQRVCLWCDSREHERRYCGSFGEHMRDGKIEFNDFGRLVSRSSGEEIPLNIGRGGQGALFKHEQATTSQVNSSANFVAVEPHSHLKA
jgi:hypothetical protein